MSSGHANDRVTAGTGVSKPTFYRSVDLNNELQFCLCVLKGVVRIVDRFLKLYVENGNFVAFVNRIWFIMKSGKSMHGLWWTGGAVFAFMNWIR
jgi:hypothetical protein